MTSECNPATWPMVVFVDLEFEFSEMFVQSGAAEQSRALYWPANKHLPACMRRQVIEMLTACNLYVLWRA